MTDKNPNVFYELGVRHALSNRTILLSQRTDDIPFDLRDCRTIVYKFTPRGVNQLKEKLKEYLEEIMNDPDFIDNPVQNYLKQYNNLLPSEKKLPRSYNALQVRYEELSSEVEKIRRQNYEFAKVVTELKEVVGSAILEPKKEAPDISGTWIDTAFGNQIKYGKKYTTIS